MKNRKQISHAWLFWGYWAPAIVTMSIIFYCSTTPLKVPQYYPSQDKFLHFVAYGAISFLWHRAWNVTFQSHSKTVIFFTSVIIATSFGILIEICQIFCNRFFEIGDIIANFVGAILGSLAYLYVYDKIMSKFDKSF